MCSGERPNLSAAGGAAMTTGGGSRRGSRSAAQFFEQADCQRQRGERIDPACHHRLPIGRQLQHWAETIDVDLLDISHRHQGIDQIDRLGLPQMGEQTIGAQLVEAHADHFFRIRAAEHLGQ